MVEIRSRYWAPVEQNTTLMAELEMVGPGKKVLEIGPGSGHLTEALAKRNCEVTCVELDDSLTSIARSYCQRMIFADVERLNLEDAFPGERFDVIVLGDVLEHLRDPGTVLRKLRACLQPLGYLVSSVPNVAHASVRLALLDGEFNYTAEGILDCSHLKFFTLRTIAAVIQDAGYQIRELRRTRVGVFNAEVNVAIENVAVSVLRRLMRDPEATTYQFIFAAEALTDNAHSQTRVAILSNLADHTWSYRKAKNRLARSLMRKGRTLLREDDSRKARAWLYRSFMLHPRLQTLVYLYLSCIRRSRFPAS